MILLKLFLTFFEIGALTFGGGYAMISLIRDAVFRYEWLTDEELINFIAVSESTPGPIVVNLATFIGSSKGGALGSLFATLGVVLPSFIIILVISALIKNFLKYESVKSVLRGIRPCTVGLILSVGVSVFLSTILGVKTYNGGFSFSLRSAVILALVAAVGITYKRIKKKAISPIILIVFSAILGAIMF